MLLSRNHRERSSSGIYRLENSHRIALLVHNIPNRGGDTLRLPQPPCTSVPRPPLAGGAIQPEPVQTSARIGLEVVHDSLRPNVAVHDDVHVIPAHVCGPKVPVAFGAALDDGCENRLSVDTIQIIGLLIHTSRLCQYPLRICFDQTASERIVFSIHGTRFIAVNVVAVTGESDEVGIQDKRSLWSRLCR